MKKVVKSLLPLLFAATSFAQSTTVWHRIVGVITVPGTSNPVAGIASGGAPWTTSGGNATVNFTQGIVTFVVEGLVLVGGNNSGTPGPVTSVRGTLVCNPGAANQVNVNTPLVPLSAQGNAVFSGNFVDGPPPATCTNPLFLIRVDAGAWLATGAVREP
jgi:hypothetical protein